MKSASNVPVASSKRPANRRLSKPAVPPEATDCRNCPLQPFTLYLGGGSGNAPEILALRTGVKVVAKKTVLFREGDPFRAFYSVREGWAACYGLSDRGTRRIFDFVLPGDPLNLSSIRSEAAHSTIEAITDMVLCAFRCSDMTRYMHGTEERWRRLEDVLIGEFVASKKKFIDWATNSSMQRVARLILSLAQRLEERGLARDGSFRFPLRYRHISDALGMTQVHVNRVMTTLRSQGIIELEKQILHIRQHRELVGLSK